MKHLLFVCLANMDRSPAAAALFENSTEYESKSCGISHSAEIPISKEAVKWADTIIVMEHDQKVFVEQKFPDFEGEIIVLNVGNEFRRFDKELGIILKRKLEGYGLL